MKAMNGWTDKSFTELLQLLKDMLPEGNTLPNRNYEAKKILCPMGMEYRKIHSCLNDCCTALVVGCDDVASCYSVGVLTRRQVGIREGSRGARVVASC